MIRGGKINSVEAKREKPGAIKGLSINIALDSVEAEGKNITIAHTYNANYEDKERLLYLLEHEDARESGFVEAYGLIDKYDGFSLSRNRAESIVAEAVAGLEVFSGGDDVASLTVLQALAKYVLVRQK